MTAQLMMQPSQPDRPDGVFVTDDNLLEAAEDPTRAFAVGVQWHPEEMTDRRLFVALVQAAERH